MTGRNETQLQNSDNSLPLRGPPFGGADLAHVNMPFAELYGADLREVDLHGASLNEADLACARLQGADLRGICLRGSDLRRADLRGADLCRADLTGANLAGALLGGARLTGAVFTGIILSDAVFDRSTCWPFGLDPRRYGARREVSRADSRNAAEEIWENEGGHLATTVTSLEEPPSGYQLLVEPPLPKEEARLAALRSFEATDTTADLELDDLTRLASLICDTPMAVISLVDKQHQWFKSREGGGAPPPDSVFSAYATLGPDLFVVPDATQDERFADDPQVIAGPGLRFYAGMPIVSEGGHVLGALGTMDHKPRELSERQKEALAILSRQAAAHLRLRRAFCALQTLEELRDRLTEMIVHDLRQPLQSLIGGLHTLPILGELNDQQREFLRMSLDGGESLLGMINDLLDISKLESGQLELEYTEIGPDRLIGEAIRKLSQLATEKTLTLTAFVEPGLPPMHGDADKLGRALVNLIGNAVKFTPPGGSIRVSLRRGQRAGTVLLSVADTGEGIPAEALGLIFEKFGQVATRTGGRKMSTGLGLTFCKMVIEAHGGSIRVESVPGRGSTFSVELPVERPLKAGARSGEER